MCVCVCVCACLSIASGGGFGVRGLKDRQQDVIQGFTTMYYYLTSSLLTRRKGWRLVHSSNSHLKPCSRDQFKMASQSVDSGNHEMILTISHSRSHTNIYFDHG